MAKGLFDTLKLPVELAGLADGATVRLVEEPLAEDAELAFFGGYADDFLADLGFDMVDEVAEKPLKAKQA